MASRAALDSARAERSWPLALTALLLLIGCTNNGAPGTPTEYAGTPSVKATTQALGEPVGGYPVDQERMLHVLMNQARVSAKTPNNNECGEYSAEVGPTPKMRPLVYSHEANIGARFSARHMSEVGCYQNENCCVLGDAGVGVGCTAPGSCSGAACAQTCDAGAGQDARQRYGLFGYNALTGVSIARNVTTAYDLWCSLMQSPGNRAMIYSDAGTEFAAGTWQNANQQCTAAYWALAFGNSQVLVPRIPAASAMYSPPNPLNTSQMYFAANYYDPSGLGPQRAEVVVEGHCFDMDRAWGYDDDGTFETRFPDPDVIPDGCHPYYFLFVDGDGGRVTYPTVGSLNVPVGQDVLCPLPYDPGPQRAADCETGSQQCPAGARRPCYTADQATLTHGECRQGTQQCRNGFWGACRDMVGPFPEACDGLDNNCDGQVDEGDPGGGASCAVFGELGLCQTGEKHCISGRVTCVSVVAPTPEICNGLDDDCDGEPDDGFGLVSCGQGDCYRLVPSCLNGLPQVCDAGLPTAEVEDGHDNDCNGFIDDGIDCHLPDGGGVNRSHAAYGAPGTPARLPCELGVEICRADGGWQTISPGRFPRPELCNNEDDNCDGLLDTAHETLGMLGYMRCGIGACTVKAIPSCSGGTPRTCNALDAGGEVCDGTDDNCDGTIDNGCNCRIDDSRVCYTGPSETRGVGVCHTGTRTCPSGTYTRCMNEVKPSQEYCNGLDDDCDGVIDNNCLADAGVDGGGGGAGGGSGGGGEDGGGGGTGGGSGGGGGGKGCACGSVDVGSVTLALLALIGARRRR